MTNIFKVEPAVILGFISAVLILLTAFGVQITDDQTTAIVGLVSAFLVLGGSFLTRAAVTPNSKVVARETKSGLIISGPADYTSTTGSEVIVEPLAYDDPRVDPINAQE